MTRDILDANGTVIGTLTMPDDTSEQVWSSVLLDYTLPPPDTTRSTAVDQAILNAKEAMLIIAYDDMTPIMKKLLLGLDLTEDEENQLIGE